MSVPGDQRVSVAYHAFFAVCMHPQASVCFGVLTRSCMDLSWSFFPHCCIGVLTPQENKTVSGHHDHRDRKDAEDYAAALNDPPVSSGSGSFKLRSSSVLAPQNDSQLVSVTIRAALTR